MSHFTDWLPLIYATLVAGAFVAYVLMDGWDLGVGILYPLVPRQERDQLLGTIAPFWDANETWLVFGGMALLLGFPLAYSTLLTRLYLPACTMLFALVLRGVSYEFRYQGGLLREFWGHLFALGSILAALAQGCMLGEVVGGMPDAQVVSPSMTALRIGFPIACGIGLVGGYGLLGACWLILKGNDGLKTRARQLARPALSVAVSLLIVMSASTPSMSPHVAERWFKGNSWPYVAIFAVVQGFVIWKLWASAWQPHIRRPLQWAAALIILSFLGLVGSLYPYIVPYEATIFEAANDRGTLVFAGIGICIVLPVVILYLVLGYRVFKNPLSRTTTPSSDPVSMG